MADGLHIAEGERPRAVVVAVQLPGVTDDELASSIAELERLATTLGLEPVGRVIQRRGKLAPGVVLGEGKLVELGAWTGGTGVVPGYVKPGRGKPDAPDADDEPATATPTARASIVLVDHDLTPTQHLNLERATGVDVLDRTSVIVEIFHRHAHTREAKLQVELARLRYLAPRLRATSSGGDRVRGGIGGKGAGESALELDRRRIRDRIAELRAELDRIEGGARTRRERRSELPTVALVGYTNAGKSSLMRALTGTTVYVADKLFATLDTTVRRLVPPTDPPILVSDTVGFIKKLPHDLVASFRSTLDAAAGADLLLHVVDAADPAHADQIAVTREVLGEIGADRIDSVLLLNKIDRVDAAGRAALAARYPGAIQLSARSPADIAALRDLLVERFAGALEQAELAVPWTCQRALHAIHERATVLAEAHDEAGTTLTIRAPARVIAELRALVTG
ncbi:MAG TPA: GTPase HflX [Kofleriaceae bacterium]|nr:GTPase HflX [Kofleriaceae bacterium]